MAASISASTSPAVIYAAALGDKTIISGRKPEEKPPGDYDQADSYNNFASDCLWSTPVNSSPTRRVPPPSYYSPQAGNPHSKYQYYFLDLKNCKCVAGQHVDFSSCEIKEQPVCDPYEHTLQRCLNCASLLHGVFGCPQPLKAAVITWHSNKVPSAFGVIEFATDLRIGRYNINGGDWEALKQEQAKKIAALSSAEDSCDTKETEQSEEDTKDKIWKRIAEEALSSPKPHKRKRMGEAEEAPEASRSQINVARSSARHSCSPGPAFQHPSPNPYAPVPPVDEDPFNNQFNSQLTPASPQLQGNQSNSKFAPEATASKPQVQLNLHSDQFDNKTPPGSYRPQPLGTSTAPQHNKPRKASDYSLPSLNSGATPFSSRGPTPTSGPEHYSEAAQAYTNLFKSEIFKYPESETEFLRLDKQTDVEFTEASYSLGLDIAAAVAEAAPSTLPQILFLSHKNHGQFILDCVKGRLRHEILPDYALDYQAKAAIDNFALALASDESDTELWRRTARIGSMLGSRRIARYCLEAAVEVDDDPTVAEVDPMSLEEGYAGEELKQQLIILGDETSLSHPVMAPYIKKRLPSFLARAIDPYPFLPDATKSLQVVKSRADGFEADQVRPPYIIKPEYHSWEAVGLKLCDMYLSPESPAATRILLALPLAPLSILPAEDARDPQQEDATVSIEDQIMKDVGTTQSPAADSSEVAVNTPTTSKSDEPPTETATAITLPVLEARRLSNVTLPTRKRSQSTAGIRETPEDDNGMQKRSKRIRNRDTTEGGAIDPATLFAEQLKPFEAADDGVFTFVSSLLTRLGVDDLGTLPDLQEALVVSTKDDHNEVVQNTAVRDLRDILKTWDDSKASTFVNGNAADILGASVNVANAGLAAFLDQSKAGPQKLPNVPMLGEADGLSEFAAKVADEWMTLSDISWEWLCVVLPTYRSSLWSDTVKIMVVRLLTYADPDIFDRIFMEMKHARTDPELLARWQVFVQTIFELHIDIYSRITNPTSAVPYETRLLTKDRLNRWADLAAGVVQTRQQYQDGEFLSRYLWASVFYATLADEVSREHKVNCWTDLQSLLRESEQPTINLHNNAVMPEISVEAAEREVSRLHTMDFFANLFQTDCSDPAAIIETLEPVLDPESARESLEPDSKDGATLRDVSSGTLAALRDMWKFLQTGSTSLRLFLWQRLREAYFSIGYNTKVFSCHLKCIEIIVGDLRTADYVDSADGPRRQKLLQWLKALDDLLVKALTIALNDASTCFEIIDERHIKSTCTALAQLSRVLHTAALFDDEVRVGITQLPQNPDYAPQGSFNSFINKLREMQVRTWALQYTMVKEAMNQNRELFPTPDNDLADYLARVHYSLGLRKCCKASNKIFLKMMKMEIIRMKALENWEDYIGQVLYDLYGLRLGVGTYLLDDHGCPAENLERRTVMQIADQVIRIANHTPIKDLLKHELRGTLETMQTAVGPAKINDQMQHNLRNYTEYLKTSIRPTDLYKAWKGQVMVDSLPVTTLDSPLADKNWYFLLGMINLTKFRSQKRLCPGAQTEDLRVAATFLRLQLQFSGDFWETWYRLAQCFDHEIEEEVMWSADKINNHRGDLVRLQRSSIHCYVMALSTAFRTADGNLETAEKLSEMYYDFGMRIYSASREPFTMEAFWVDEFEKHMSGPEGMYKKPLHEELTRYRAWNYASRLFKESLRDRPNNWMSHFMIGKCQWKMFCRACEEWDPKVKATKPAMESVLSSFSNAIKKAPRHNANSRSEPVLEPHYKLVSVVHKLVLMQAMPAQDAADLLQKQPSAPLKGEAVVVDTPESWDSYILSNLRHLRALDKQHWNHRMVARVANILYDDTNPNFEHAMAARNELRESIFTKTMHIQVWKSDAERVGRHCVYMERYVLLMVKLLHLTNDKTSMEALVKRVRKKNHDFHKFDKVWHECCTTYLGLIRRSANITASMDDIFKSSTHEEFDAFSNRLDEWSADPRMSHPALDALKEAGDLKKLNSGLFKATPIDDLINDAYATLFTQVAKLFPDPDPDSLGNSQIDGAVPESSTATSTRVTGPMHLNNLVMDMDGTQNPVPVTTAGSEPVRPRKPGISRREVLRRAEQTLSRIPDVARAVPGSSVRPPEPSLALGSNDWPVKGKRSGGSTPRVRTPAMHDAGRVETPAQMEEREEAEAEAEAAKQAQDTESVRGSVHDSADDESDLSDPPDMDDVDGSSLFPGLMGADGDGSDPEEDEEEDGGDEKILEEEDLEDGGGEGERVEEVEETL
ncbi:putative transcriptional corepressor [Diplocarpon rosae]|nr:putative transcriptional corepressor [Diplocarpon rosae]